MGFFGNLFKKKKGGTFFGNLLRGASNIATGGILGSGAQLAKNDEKLAQAEFEKAKALENANSKNSTAFQIGAALGSPLKKPFNKVVTESDASKKLQNQQIMAWFKRNWIKIVGGIVSIVAIIFLIKKFKRVKAF